MRTAWIFPGQGSQKVGMAVDLTNLPTAGEKFSEAAALLGWSVLAVCQGEAGDLAQTRYTQPCLYVVEAILADALLARDHQPELVAGHSLGEYSALYAAGVFDFVTGLQLVKQRAELMAGAAGGKMAALIGCDREQLQAALTATAEVVLANDNSDAQVVISGTPAGVDAVLAQVQAKRAVPLAVSGAFHSPLMAAAAGEFQTALDAVPFREARWPVLSNTDPIPEQSGAALKTRLSRQMTGSVRWRETMAQFASAGLEQVLEIGPGQVLTGLCKRGCPQLQRLNVSNAAAVTAL
ncbi:MAG: ACP S-malonyltransferase [Spirulinaceae cyanobacterium SM2_1_0]|nr:ACP S-malonyltransferase [Spirulinaceae cyanobacterium SM2_1_0]